MDERCYVCKSSDLQIFNLTSPEDSDSSQLLVCKDCGYAKRHDKIDFKENIQTQQEVFNRTAEMPKVKPRWPNRDKLIASKAERLVKEKGKLLDIGCGMGKWLSCFGQEWGKYGVEVSPAAAQISSEFADANIICGAFEDLNFEPDSFDLITAFALIEHMTDPRFLMKWVYDHLKRDGLFILLTCDRESEVAQKSGPNWILYKPVEHVCFFSARSLRLLFEQEKFKIIKEEWRHAKYVSESILYLKLAKIKEILGMVKSPKYDHYYIYARKC
ncbi:MAG: class I SAM-dependent methyltransferase [Planctomycetota bacterium]